MEKKGKEKQRRIWVVGSHLFQDCGCIVVKVMGSFQDYGLVRCMFVAGPQRVGRNHLPSHIQEERNLRFLRLDNLSSHFSGYVLKLISR
jgi:hypothetical protein